MNWLIPLRFEVAKTKDSETIQSDIKQNFEKQVGDTIQDGSVLDLLLAVLGEEGEKIYQAIDDNRTPHVWTSLSGKRLDDTGVMVNCPRKTGESDTSYKYRLLAWVLNNEASNQTAINNALILPKYASDIEFIPQTKGAGTATCYIIPKSYDSDTVENALREARELVEAKADPSVYVEYITPKIKGVKLQIFLSNESGDVSQIKEYLSSEILEYINNIAPNDYLDVGVINRIGLSEQNIDYFSVLSVIIDGETVDNIKILQPMDTKFLFDEIIWSGDE